MYRERAPRLCQVPKIKTDERIREHSTHSPLDTRSEEVTVRMEEEAGGPVQGEQLQMPVVEEEEDWNAASENLAGSEEDINDSLLDQDGQMTPIDDLALP